MRLNKKYTGPLIWTLLGSLSLLVMQSIWIYNIYQSEHKQLMIELKEALSLAYQKEQTYRIPVVDIVNPGEVSIQSCGNEEIIIVRKCSDSDTIVYNNVSGRSIEKFISNVFWDLRENIVPMNIYCLSDLFAGMLHDKDIPLLFVIERHNIKTNAVLETSRFPDEHPTIHKKYENSITLEISDTEAICAKLQITPMVVFRNVAGTLVCSFILTIIIFLCLLLLFRRSVKQNKHIKPINNSPQQTENSTFQIGKYSFNPFKNELEGFGETIQLNKKENAILYALYIQQGNIVERNALLEENWGNNGIIYSRSLDTYLATLRKYLKKDPNIQIVTVKGVGYKLVYMES